MWWKIYVKLHMRNKLLDVRKNIYFIPHCTMHIWCFKVVGEIAWKYGICLFHISIFTKRHEAVSISMNHSDENCQEFKRLHKTRVTILFPSSALKIKVRYLYVFRNDFFKLKIEKEKKVTRVSELTVFWSVNCA